MSFDVEEAMSAAKKKRPEARKLTLVECENLVSYHMDEILGCFKPGRKITVAVRSPGKPDQDFVMTSDDLDEVIAMLARRNA